MTYQQRLENETQKLHILNRIKYNFIKYKYTKKMSNNKIKGYILTF